MRLVAVFVAALALASPASAAVVVATAAQNGKAVTLKKGDVLAIVLEANPSTGYRWQVTAKPAFLSAPGTATVTPKTARLVGVPGVQVLTFHAPVAGKGVLRLVEIGPGGAAGTIGYKLTVRVT